MIKLDITFEQKSQKISESVESTQTTPYSEKPFNSSGKYRNTLLDTIRAKITKTIRISVTDQHGHPCWSPIFN